jgi:hypothetical protein
MKLSLILLFAIIGLTQANLAQDLHIKADAWEFRNFVKYYCYGKPTAQEMAGYEKCLENLSKQVS